MIMGRPKDGNAKTYPIHANTQKNLTQKNPRTETNTHMHRYAPQCCSAIRPVKMAPLPHHLIRRSSTLHDQEFRYDFFLRVVGADKGEQSTLPEILVSCSASGVL